MLTLSRKWATGTGDGGDPSGTGTPAVTDPNAEAEALRQEVERLKGAVEQGKAEKTTLEETKANLAAAEQRIAELEANGSTPTAAPSASPVQSLTSEMEWYQQRIANARASNLRDPEAERLLRLAQQDYQAMQWHGIRQRELPKLARVPERFRAKTSEMFDTGRFLTMEDAAVAAQGIILAQEAETGAAEIARRKAADEAAARAAAGKPDTGGGSGREPTATMEGRKLTGSEFKKLTANKTPEARKLWDQLDAGQIEVDWTR